MERERDQFSLRVDENSPPRGGGNEWRATMGDLASES